MRQRPVINPISIIKQYTGITYISNIPELILFYNNFIINLSNNL